MRALGLAGGVLRAPAELSIAAVESALYELKLLAPLKSRSSSRPASKS
jgi:hypothetical protein